MYRKENAFQTVPLLGIPALFRNSDESNDLTRTMRSLGLDVRGEQVQILEKLLAVEDLPSDIKSFATLGRNENSHWASS